MIKHVGTIQRAILETIRNEIITGLVATLHRLFLNAGNR